MALFGLSIAQTLGGNRTRSSRSCLGLLSQTRHNRYSRRAGDVSQHAGLGSQRRRLHVWCAACVSAFCPRRKPQTNWRRPDGGGEGVTSCREAIPRGSSPIFAICLELVPWSFGRQAQFNMWGPGSFSSGGLSLVFRSRPPRFPAAHWYPQDVMIQGEVRWPGWVRCPRLRGPNERWSASPGM